MTRQDYVGQRRGFIHETGQADNQRYLGQRLPEPGRRWQSKHRVGTVEDQNLDIALQRILGEFEHCTITGLVRVGDLARGCRVEHQPTGLAEVAHQIIECIDGDQGVNTITMIPRASSTDSKAGIGVDKGVTQAGDGVRRDTGLLGYLVCRVLCKCCCPVFADRLRGSDPRSTMWWASPRAKIPSVPGLAAIHSSAAAPLRDILGSI